MIVYTVETIGGQITSYEANKENLPKFLEKPVKESFKKYGFCMLKTPEYECIISYFTGRTTCYTMDN